MPNHVQSRISAKIALSDAFGIDLERDAGSQHSPCQIVNIPHGCGTVICRKQLPCGQHEVVADRRMRVRVIVCCKSTLGDQVVQIRPTAGIAHNAGIALVFFHHNDDVFALRHQ